MRISDWSSDVCSSDLLADSDAKGLRRRMLAAGFRSPNAPKIFTLVRIVLIFALPSIILLPQFVSGKQISLLSLYLQGAFFALMGLVVPNLFLTAKADRRQQEILNGFPACLDLMLVCVEAGKIGRASCRARVCPYV